MEKAEYNKEEKNQLFYYKNCQIINKEILDFLNEIDKDICKNEISFKCYLVGNKIWSRLDDNIINIGKIENNIFIVENIIVSDKKSSSIINYILTNEIKDLKDYQTNYNLIEFKEKKNQYSINKIEGKIYNLFEEEFKINEKLKTIISLFVNMIYFKYKEQKKNNKNERIFLLDKKLTETFSEEFKIIKKLYNENEEKQNKINNIIINSVKNKQFINDIIFNLNNEELKKLDGKILKERKSIPSKINSTTSNLIDNNIIIYKDFIFVYEHIYDIIKNQFDNSINQQEIYYSSHKDEDILSIATQNQNIILIGRLYPDNYTFEIKYIFDYNSSEIFNKEKNIILGGDINNYIESKTIYGKNKDEYSSPILSENKLIGYFYIYQEGKRYDNEFNYYNILTWDKIKNSIDLYYNYKSIDEKLKKSKSRSENQKYYIINKQTIADIKNNNDFKNIYELLEKNNIEEKDNNSSKNILLALKNLSESDLKPYKKNYNSKIKYGINEFGPNINYIKYFDKAEKDLIIYNNFELIRKDIIEKLIDNIKDMNSFLLECILTEGKIIINYPDDLNQNKKFVSVIGKLDYDKNFITEYILIFNKKNDKITHINKIKDGLKQYLKGLQIYNNSDVIIDKQYNEIGVIVKYGKNSTDNFEDYQEPIPNQLNPKTANPQKSYKKFKDNKNVYDYHLDDNLPFNDIRQQFNSCPKIGLQNIGATCYMNATLQCFCHIKKFLDYFKYSKKVKDRTRNDKNGLTPSFKLLVENLWPNNLSNLSKDYAPYEFKDKISNMNPLFKGVAANDAKDLVNFIIMTLHEELNSLNSNNNITYNPNMMMQQTNQQFMLNTFVQNFKNSNKSIISDLFYGMNCNITQCGECRVQTYNYQTYFFIVFPLEEIRKFRLNNLNNNFQMNQYNNFYNNQFNYGNYNNFNNYNNINIQEVTIFDCFDYDCKINEMSGANAMYCNYCKRTCTSNMRTVLTSGPQILILLLNRGKGIEFDVKLNFPEQLNISKYLQFNNQGFLYQLIGVITHIGESGMGGHFIAYCRDPLTLGWDKYNDSIVTKVTNFQNEVLNFANPYLLFYQQIR